MLQTLFLSLKEVHLKWKWEFIFLGQHSSNTERVLQLLFELVATTLCTASYGPLVQFLTQKYIH